MPLLSLILPWQRRLRRACATMGMAAVLLLGSRAAVGQLLPSLPALPKLGAALPTDRLMREPLGELDPDRLAEVRRTRLRNLVLTHADVLEADPDGAPMLRGEIVAIAPSDAALAQALAAGFVIARRELIDGVGEIIVMASPRHTATARALKNIRHADPAGLYAFNHVFLPSSLGTVEKLAAEPAPIDATQSAAHGARPRAGLIDAGVDARHAVFAAATLHPWGCGGTAVPSGHGTAVASILAGQSADFVGAAPGAELYAADVYCGASSGGATDAVVGALSWLLRERVPVINMSLVGPSNVVLEQIIKLAIARGAIVVAAVGNDGPAAPPAYPASYAGVIAVTAVDARGRVLLESGHALHVDFAAPGADMLAATSPTGYTAVRGTSFAAPVVAGLLARELAAPDADGARAAVARLAAAAIPAKDGAAGRHYGKGLVGETVRVPVSGGASGRNRGGGSF
jgi:hypothetical protein